MIILFWWYWNTSILVKFHICKEQNMHSWKKEYQINDKDKIKFTNGWSFKPLWILMYPKDSMIWYTTTGIL